MLLELEIKNFAVVAQQQISFKSGLNVITGETGAGKSVVLKALELLLGARANTDLIRNGEDALEVQACFDISSLKDKENLPDIVKESEQLVLFRSLNQSGKNKVYINGHMSNVSQLAEVTNSLINLCRQGQQVQLLNSKYHLELLDDYADLDQEINSYQNLYLEWREKSQELERAREEYEVAKDKTEELENEIKELEAIDPQADLREILNNKIKQIKNKELTVSTCNQLSEILNADQGVYSNLTNLTQGLSELKKSGFDVKEAEEILDQVHSLSAELEKSLKADWNYDDENEDLDSLENNLAEVARLHRKYKTDDNGLIAFLDQKQKDYQHYQKLESPSKLQEKVDLLEEELSSLAQTISKQRKAAALQLSKDILKQLADLNLAKSEFKIDFHQIDLGAKGIDKIEFLISTNPGEKPKALQKVSSGGEISRILLALKTILNSNLGISCLIFDEIDTGISGATSQAVGEKLKTVAQNSQVICVTHLPQVAAFADNHLLVSKTSDKKTYSQVEALELEERVEELARMLSGYEVKNNARKIAKEMIGLSC